MSFQSKICDLDTYIKDKEAAEEILKIAKKRNISRKIAYLYEEILKLEEILKDQEIVEA
jgi:hypothetical protein